MLRMQRSSFCCGVVEIGGFGPVPAPTLAADLDARILEAREMRGLIIASLNSNQRPSIGPILEKWGFAQVSEAENPQTGRQIYLYSRDASAPLPRNRKTER